MCSISLIYYYLFFLWAGLNLQGDLSMSSSVLSSSTSFFLFRDETVWSWPWFLSSKSSTLAVSSFVRSLMLVLVGVGHTTPSESKNNKHEQRKNGVHKLPRFQAASVSSLRRLDPVTHHNLDISFHWTHGDMYLGWYHQRLRWPLYSI